MLRGAERGGAFRWQRQGEVRASRQSPPPESDRDPCAPPPRVTLGADQKVPASLLTTRWLGAWARDGSRGGGCLCRCRSPSSCSSSSVFMDRPCLARPAHRGGGELGAGGTGTAAAACCCCCCSSFSSSSCCRTWRRSRCEGRPPNPTPSRRRAGPHLLAPEQLLFLLPPLLLLLLLLLLAALLLPALALLLLPLRPELHFSALLELAGRDQTPGCPGHSLAPDTQGLRPQGPTHFVLQLELF